LSFTLRGRIETRLAASLPPIVAACGVTLTSHEWWPLQLTALMLGVGLLLDVVVYDRLLPYQPGWLAPLLGAAEFAAVLALVRTLGVEAPAAAAYGFFAGAWLVAQIAVHAGFPAALVSYGEDGGELGRAGAAVAVLVVAIGASAGGVAWAAEPPTVRLSAGVHNGPLILDHAQKLAGEPGAVVRGGIVITADDVSVRDVTVLAEENGIEVHGAEDVVLERVRISGATLDGINVRRGSLAIRDCLIHSPADEYAQGIDISFSIDLAPSLVEGCEIIGGYEGIVSHSAHVEIRENRVRDTTLRGIAITEMSMGTAEGNEVRDGLGVGIYCGDYSHCLIERNSVSGTRPDLASSNGTRMGYGILATFGAEATLRENQLTENHRRTRAFADARIHRVD
jgi:nitrous oxidase accessory protein NosD